MTSGERIKRAAARFERELAVQGWLCVIFALAALLASLLY